jgi:hypothetical protein
MKTASNFLGQVRKNPSQRSRGVLERRSQGRSPLSKYNGEQETALPFVYPAHTLRVVWAEDTLTQGWLSKCVLRPRSREIQERLPRTPLI